MLCLKGLHAVFYRLTFREVFRAVIELPCLCTVAHMYDWNVMKTNSCAPFSVHSEYMSVYPCVLSGLAAAVVQKLFCACQFANEWQDGTFNKKKTYK